MTDIKATNTARILSLIGICRKAGGIIPGAGAVLSEMKKDRRLRAVIISSDASDRTVKQLSDKAGYRNIPISFPNIDSDELGHAIGIKAPVAVIALSGAGPVCSLLDVLFPDGETDQNR